MLGLVIVVLVVLIACMVFTDKCDGVKTFLKSFTKPTVVSNATAAALTPTTTSTGAAPAPAAATVESFSDVMSPSMSPSEIMSTDYNTAMQHMGLEDSVFSSHNKFASELSKKTSTSSKFALRDDSQDVVGWVGLRRPKYQTVASSQADARQVSSESPDQMHEYRPFTL
jgi:hypothetical protein